MNVIDHFDGEYAFLSNFYGSPIYFATTGKIAPTVEHYFQAAKCCYCEDMDKILSAPTPGKAKRLGRSIPLRADWENIKLAVMERALNLKFASAKSREKLLTTGDAYLKEGNTWHDNFWGDCSCDRCKNILGQNHLGRLLMKIRAELAEAMKEED